MRRLCRQICYCPFSGFACVTRQIITKEWKVVLRFEVSPFFVISYLIGHDDVLFLLQICCYKADCTTVLMGTVRNLSSLRFVLCSPHPDVCQKPHLIMQLKVLYQAAVFCTVSRFEKIYKVRFGIHGALLDQSQRTAYKAEPPPQYKVSSYSVL